MDERLRIYIEDWLAENEMIADEMFERSQDFRDSPLDSMVAQMNYDGLIDYTLSEQSGGGDYWVEARTEVVLGENHYTVIFNHDVVIPENTEDLIEVLEKLQKDCDILINDIKNN